MTDLLLAWHTKCTRPLLRALGTDPGAPFLLQEVGGTESGSNLVFTYFLSHGDSLHRALAHPHSLAGPRPLKVEAQRGTTQVSFVWLSRTPRAWPPGHLSKAHAPLVPTWSAEGEKPSSGCPPPPTWVRGSSARHAGLQNNGRGQAQPQPPLSVICTCYRHTRLWSVPCQCQALGSDGSELTVQQRHEDYVAQDYKPSQEPEARATQAGSQGLALGAALPELSPL